MKSRLPSKDQWQEWLQSSATEAIRDALSLTLKRQEQAAKDAYMAGNPWPEASRLALIRMQQWHEDLFAASYEDLITALEDK